MEDIHIYLSLSIALQDICQLYEVWHMAILIKFTHGIIRSLKLSLIPVKQFSSVMNECLVNQIQSFLQDIVSLLLGMCTKDKNSVQSAHISSRFSSKYHPPPIARWFSGVQWSTVKYMRIKNILNEATQSPETCFSSLSSRPNHLVIISTMLLEKAAFEK